VVHEKSFVEPSAHLGQGCQVMPFALVHKFSTIGNFCILNTQATIDHECLIGDGVHIMGNAVVTGRVEIGDYATIGTNATILPSLQIGEGAFVGAGAVVCKNVEPYSVVAGVPANKIRENQKLFFGDVLAEIASLTLSNRQTF
jgi:sugar O-acyltransferase (sialic acid O-acetyltransferase NeuD family)